MAIRILEWDSAFFGFRVAHFETGRKIANVKSIDAFARKNGVALVQCCIDIRKPAIIAQLESDRFRFVDLKMSYSANLRTLTTRKSRAVAATIDDCKNLKRIARRAFGDNRYGMPPFKPGSAARLYETWVEKSLAGKFDDTCLKIEQRGVPVGFVTARTSGAPARIGLLAMKEGYRSRGLGRELLHALARGLLEHGIDELEVVTQGRNILAQNFYHRNGFRLRSIAAWLYKSY
jgi:dTDP-4-amino-4,6-dideoxy-D-galactose acyltransferase